MRFLSILFFCFFVINTNAAKVVYLQKYLDADTLSYIDAVPAIRKAIKDCVRFHANELLLPEGTLNLKPDYAFEKYEYISNNDPSMKRIAFCLENLKDFTIRGNNTKLLFSGFMSAFSLSNCSDIKIEGISIDYVHPFVSEGKIVDAGTGWYELKFPDSCRVDLLDGSLCIRDEYGITYPFSSLLEFDTERREVAYHAHDYWIYGRTYPAVKTQDGNYRLYRKDFGEARIGNTMVLGATARLNPAFTLWECENINLMNVDIYHCGGMGVIAQSSRNIELNWVNVMPPSDSGRIISASADATHFVNCKGYIRLLNCIFRNQKDDATNIHGWYMAIERVLSPEKLLLRWHNSGQFGIRFIKKGMMLEFVDNTNLETYARLQVKSVTYLNAEYAEVTFNQKVPEQVSVNHVVAEDDEYPDVLIKGCYIGNNRARGLLIGSRNRVIIEDCTFHTPGAAILFEGDGNYWYEQSGVWNVIIRNNLFDNCMYGSFTWGNACIAVGSGIPQKKNSRYHRNIVVENNTFETFDSRIVNLYCVDGFIFRNNKIVMSDKYKTYGDSDKRYVTEYCDNVRFE